jgi:hypothetical protein
MVSLRVRGLSHLEEVHGTDYAYELGGGAYAIPMSSSAYQAENGTPMLLPSIVAFIDILGFAQEMKASHAAGQSNALLQRVTRVVHK